MVELLTLLWLFQPSGPAASTFAPKAPRAEFAAPADPKAGFTVKLTVTPKPFSAGTTVVDVPGVLRVRLRQHDRNDRDRQNYPAFPLPDGSVPVLEAELFLHSEEHPDWRSMTVGLPLGILERPWAEHEVVLDFSGPRWTLFVDGARLDNDFPFGYPRWPDRPTWTIDAATVASASIYLPAIRPEVRKVAPPGPAPGVQYWVPGAHNDWVGDVATCFIGGRYHVFYLYDRRHHQSKFGRGAHYFEHLSTPDFRTWTEHDAATPIEEQWECIGTGVPFVLDGRLHLSYGLHTTRVYPEDRTALPSQRQYLKEHGVTAAFGPASTPGVPAGSTYSVSSDGGRSFAKSRVLFHPCENPSVYIDPAGKLRMLANYRAKGLWESATLDGGWRCLDPDFPPGGDCTTFFRWGNFDYVIGGFTGLWSKPADAPVSAYRDLVREGLDFYDGSNVPAVTDVGGRYVMAAWVPVRGWGGPLVLRELIQLPDGRVGSKWLPEVVPETGPPETLAERVAENADVRTPGSSFLLSFTVHPTGAGGGRCGVSFLPAKGDDSGCELQVRPGDGRAQFGPGSADRFAADQRSLREGGKPHEARDYAIEHLIGVDRPFPVRVVVKHTRKLGGSLIDAEIAGQRTMIGYRPDLEVGRLVLRADGAEVRDVRISPLAGPK